MAYSLASSESISDISAKEELQVSISVEDTWRSTRDGLAGAVSWSETGGSVPPATLSCDAYHHYYHYQSSAQYLWLATTLRVLGRTNDAIVAYNNAIFQDHFNQEALDGKKELLSENSFSPFIPKYDKHPVTDAEFCKSIGELPNACTKLHDKAAAEYLAGKYAYILSIIPPDSFHSNSCFLLGKCWFHLQRYGKATDNFREAIRLSHMHHDRYHHHASTQHFLRGTTLFYGGDLDLAIADFTKALDLNRNNCEAKMARARAYKEKGNMRMAQMDNPTIV